MILALLVKDSRAFVALQGQQRIWQAGVWQPVAPDTLAPSIH